MLLKQKISFYLENIETPTGRVVYSIITGSILLSSMIFVIDTYSISENIRDKLNLAESVILLLFAVEYLLRFWCAENKVRYFFSFYSAIDLIAILPFLAGWINISFILILRWFRILRLVRLVETKKLPSNFSSEESIIFGQILFTIFAIIFVYSGLIYQVEHPVNPEDFGTFVDAVYFSVVTMTTVGFGDVTPISQVGRILTIMMIFTGIALIPSQVGYLIKRLVRTADRVERLCPNCTLSFHDGNANFCKNCGTKLEI